MRAASWAARLEVVGLVKATLVVGTMMAGCRWLRQHRRQSMGVVGAEEVGVAFGV